MILITSAAYVNSEFQIEFGKLPPALLPVQNRRLFEHQIRALRAEFPQEVIFLSMPKGYPLSVKDEIFLERNHTKVIWNETELSLGQSIEAALVQTGINGGVLRVLHGDTLLTDIPADTDCIGIVHTNEDYPWEVEEVETGYEAVWCGYFAFSDLNEFRYALAATNYSFVGAVRRYNESRALMRSRIDGWYDFGHVNTYFQSRAKMTTERAFNQLIISDACVRKSGEPHEKIIAEYSWFANLPPKLRVFAPQLIEHGSADGQPYYVLEYLPLPPLNEVYVHGRNPVFYWDKVFNLCADFLATCAAQPLSAEEKDQVALDSSAMVIEKTWNRLERYIETSDYPGLDVPQKINGVEVPSIRKIVEACVERIVRTRPVPGILHGDLCLSNILFDSRSDRIKVLDPRGLNAYGHKTAVGDLRYDLAKLSHSIIGLYDYIIAGAYDLDAKLSQTCCDLSLKIHIDQRLIDIQSAFLKRSYIAGQSVSDVMPITIMLFFAMLPLHADDTHRQRALLANALRLYVDYFIG